LRIEEKRKNQQERKQKSRENEKLHIEQARIAEKRRIDQENEQKIKDRERKQQKAREKIQQCPNPLTSTERLRQHHP
jgi:hypothetical protein